jgi:hypothetical protein
MSGRAIKNRRRGGNVAKKPQPPVPKGQASNASVKAGK